MKFIQKKKEEDIVEAVQVYTNGSDLINHTNIQYGCLDEEAKGLAQKWYGTGLNDDDTIRLPYVKLSSNGKGIAKCRFLYPTDYIVRLSDYSVVVMSEKEFEDRYTQYIEPQEDPPLQANILINDLIASFINQYEESLEVVAVEKGKDGEIKQVFNINGVENLSQGGKNTLCISIQPSIKIDVAQEEEAIKKAKDIVGHWGVTLMSLR